MITVSKLINELQKLERQGHGNAGVVIQNGNNGEIRSATHEPIYVNQKHGEHDEPEDVSVGETYATIFCH
jgi:hypothetical protein